MLKSLWYTLYYLRYSIRTLVIVLPFSLFRFFTIVIYFTCTYKSCDTLLLFLFQAISYLLKRLNKFYSILYLLIHVSFPMLFISLWRCRFPSGTLFRHPQGYLLKLLVLKIYLVMNYFHFCMSKKVFVLLFVRNFCWV